MSPPSRFIRRHRHDHERGADRLDERQERRQDGRPWTVGALVAAPAPATFSRSGRCASRPATCRLRLIPPAAPHRSAAPIIPLVRVGGEGGLLDDAVLEGDATFLRRPAPSTTKYNLGEIRASDPGTRADVVAAIPASATGRWRPSGPRTTSALAADAGPERVATHTPTVPVAAAATSRAPPCLPTQSALARPSLGPLGRSAGGRCPSPPGRCSTRARSPRPSLGLGPAPATSELQWPRHGSGRGNGHARATRLHRRLHRRSPLAIDDALRRQLGDMLELYGQEHDRRAPPVPPARLLDPAARLHRLHRRRRPPPSGSRSPSRVHGQHRRPGRLHADVTGSASRTGRSSTGSPLAARSGRWVFHCHIFGHAAYSASILRSSPSSPTTPTGNERPLRRRRRALAHRARRRRPPRWTGTLRPIPKATPSPSSASAGHRDRRTAAAPGRGSGTPPDGPLGRRSCSSPRPTADGNARPDRPSRSRPRDEVRRP